MIQSMKSERRGLGDPLFEEGDAVCGPWDLQGVVEIDDEDLCHNELAPFHCEVPGCGHVSRSLLESEQHYCARHRYECVQCHKHLATPHLLDLHLCEAHDSFFAVLSAKQPSYTCFVESCQHKFHDGKERIEHCVEVHKYPKDYRYDESRKSAKKSIKNQGVDENGLQSSNVRVTKAAKKKTSEDKKERKTSKTQHLGSGSKHRGGSLNWYQRRQPQVNKVDSSIDMQDLTDALPTSR